MKASRDQLHLSSQLSDSMSAIENVAFLGKLSPSSASRKLDTFSIFWTIFVMLLRLFSLLGSLTYNNIKNISTLSHLESIKSQSRIVTSTFIKLLQSSSDILKV